MRIDAVEPCLVLGGQEELKKKKKKKKGKKVTIFTIFFRIEFSGEVDLWGLWCSICWAEAFFLFLYFLLLLIPPESFFRHLLNTRKEVIQIRCFLLHGTRNSGYSGAIYILCSASCLGHLAHKLKFSTQEHTC